MTEQFKNPYESITFGNSLLLRVDGAIGTMSLSPNGRDAVLAGRKGLFIIDLDDPFTTPRWLHHITSWEVADVQWSPHHSAKPSWVISTSNQKALLWDLARPSSNAIINVLHQHSRAITDINFHPSDPEVLATCSVDTFVLGWDMRTPRKPVARWAEWRAGATQVKWNHDNPYEIASSHDNSFYIWDTRKGALPVVKVNQAHTGKINGIDFSGGSSNIITCSNDSKIKFWDLTSYKIEDFSSDFNYFANENERSTDIRPSVVINTSFPVARARNLPFGSEKACGIMPLIGGENSIHIVNYDHAHTASLGSNRTQVIDSDPVFKFQGHNGAIKDFLWRTRHSNYMNFESRSKWKDFQLVTWSSQDCDLKLWPHDERLYKSVNYNPTHEVLNIDINEDTDSDSPKPTQPVIDKSRKVHSYDYQSYIVEPKMTISDLNYLDNKDILSSISSYQIHRAARSSEVIGTQLNHLDWISGVRIGNLANNKNDNENSIADVNGPNNLGEEVTIVGHKFPKVRFEKISVSTGELVLSLKGPVPSLYKYMNTDNSKIEGNDTRHSNKNHEKGEKRDLENSELLKNEDLTSRQISTNLSNDSGGAKKKNITQAIPSSRNQNDKDVDGILLFNSKLDSEKPENTDNNPNNSNSAQKSSEEANTENRLVFIRLEIKFPSSYPFLEILDDSGLPPKRLSKLQKMNTIHFNIEETHEIDSSLKTEMLKSLKEISFFYTNKHKKFCLEPCLRFLMGDKIELVDSLVVGAESEPNRSNSLGEESIIEEIGTEGWADDLIQQQPDYFHSDEEDNSEQRKNRMISPLNDYDEDEDTAALNADFLPTVDDPASNSLHDIRRINTNDSDLKHASDSLTQSQGNIGSVPIPKSCGAVWTPSGKLVCFFFPKQNEEESKSFQKFNIFQFTEEGNHSSHSSHHNNRNQDFKDNENDTNNEKNEYHGSLKSLAETDDDETSSESVDRSDTESISSEDSFTNDLDDILMNDLSSRSRTPGLFKTAVGLGNRYVLENKKLSLSRLKNYGTTTNSKSSVPGEHSQSFRRKKEKLMKKTNTIEIFDYSHLLPNKYELALEYRVLGDSPSKLARYNSAIAFKYGYQDVGEVWQIVEMLLEKKYEDNDLWSSEMHREQTFSGNNAKNYIAGILRSGSTNFMKKSFEWGPHPFGRTWLVSSIFDYFEKLGNVQMLAMLSCILFENKKNEKYTTLYNIPINTPYQVLPPAPPASIETYKGLNKTIDHFGILYDDYGSELPSGSSRTFTLIGKPAHYNSYPMSNSSSFDVESWKEKRGNNPDLFRKLIPQKSMFFNPSDTQLHKLEKHGRSLPRPHMLYNKVKIQGQTQRSLRGVVSMNQRAGKMSMKQKHRNTPTVTINLQNSDTLDLFEDSTSIPLLEVENKIESYRKQYSELLFYWGLPINRIKILKFNFSDAAQKSESQFEIHKCNFAFRKAKKDPTGFRDIFGGALTRKRQNELTPSSRTSFATHKCNLCKLVIDKRAVICINCEHVLHFHCAAEWWGDSDSEENDEFQKECPSGCGCVCIDHSK